MRGRHLWLPLLLAGCGDGDVARTTNDPVALNVIEATAKGTSAKLAAAVDCGNLPDFVPVYEGARITTCVSGPDGRGRHVSGNIVYSAAATPDRILAWSRERARAAGLAERLVTPLSFAAGEKTQRSLMVITQRTGAETRVMITWSSGI